MIYRIDVSPRPGISDARGESLRRQAEALGVTGVAEIHSGDIYFLQGELDAAAVDRLVHELLHDPVVEDATWRLLEAKAEVEAEAKFSTLTLTSNSNSTSVEVALLPGVTDSVAESLLAGARTIGVLGLAAAATGHRYVLSGSLDETSVHRIATGLLANEVIQTYTINAPIPPPLMPEVEAGDENSTLALASTSTVEVIPLFDLDDAGLIALSQERRLSLDLAEMQAIRAHFRGQGREPTDIELEMLAQTWSEHCVHKTFRALIDYEERTPDGQPIPGTQRTIDSLLKTYIRAATEAVAKSWVRSAFVDNAGIIAFDDRYDLAFKVETHNHPSALEPFGGANTGVGGVVRDVIGVSARPIANTDVLCFGPPHLPLADVPAGVLHPRRIADGVTAGVEDYGNKMGIPTVNGAILYDPGYTANPLVFCGCLGILPHGSHRTEPQPGDLAVVIGGRTGRDGLRGATFSSMEMDHLTGHIAGSAVQIGHPIHEKQALEAVLAARDAGLYTAITDCGAGGLSSAVGEMAKELGAEVHLERVPLKYPGLRPWEIWLSEAQERMVLAIPEGNWPAFEAICRGLDVEATALGRFTGDGQVTLRYEGRLVGQLPAEFLHDGIPRRHLQAVWTCSETEHPERSRGPSTALRSAQDGPGVVEGCGATEILLALLAAPDTRSKEDVVRRYDHEVQAATVVKPFVGPANNGPSDAAVLLPMESSKAGSWQGLALAAGINPAYGSLDPYLMAWAAVDEAVRNCVAVGADPDRTALLDNFCWGNPLLPDRLGGLVRCAQGCYDAAVAYGMPYVSGKDSLNNEYTGADGRKHAIPGTLLISALGSVPDVRRTATSDLKAAGDLLYLVGATAGELGGSAYARLNGLAGGAAPQPAAAALTTFRALHGAIGAGLVRACHDLSEGGLAVALAEMALAGGLGADLDLACVPTKVEAEAKVKAKVKAEVKIEAYSPLALASTLTSNLTSTSIAFSESLSRFIVEVSPGDAAAFEARFAGLAAPCEPVGRVRGDDAVRLIGLAGRPFIETTLAAIERAWRGHIA